MVQLIIIEFTYLTFLYIDTLCDPTLNLKKRKKKKTLDWLWKEKSTLVGMHNLSPL
jgi:hypothetical protein